MLSERKAGFIRSHIESVAGHMKKSPMPPILCSVIDQIASSSTTDEDIRACLSMLQHVSPEIEIPNSILPSRNNTVIATDRTVPDYIWCILLIKKG